MGILDKWVEKLENTIAEKEARQELIDNPKLQKSSQFEDAGKSEKEDFYLMDENCLIVSPSLACVVGINHAIVLQQVHYFSTKNKSRKGHSAYLENGRYWMWASLSDWQRQLPFLSTSTIKRILHELVAEQRVLLRRRKKVGSVSRTYYSVDYDKLSQLIGLYERKKYQAEIMHKTHYNQERNIIEDIQ